ncbi:MAG: hypothetical protein JWP69_1108 [Flaviaesturariibacter sp.]|nr:hypothetical protein [Flaviaesturariibacter sp.]
MGFEVIVSRDSQMEITEAIEWYESKRIGLGLYFAKEAEELLSRLSQNPQHYSFTKRSFRQVKFPSFPYKIYFKIKETNVVVFGVFHTGRNPNPIFKRAVP